MKINRAEWANWRSLAESSAGLSAEQAQWGVRMLALSLAAMACLSALIQIVGSWRTQDVYSESGVRAEKAADSAELAVDALSVETVTGWGWYSAPQVAESVEVEAEPEEEAVQKTRLKLRLEGIVMAAMPEDSVAIIALNERSDQYKQGAKIPVASGVTLRKIKIDRVLLDNNGKLEELLLFSTEMMQQRRVESGPAQSATPGVLDKRSDEPLVAKLGRFRDMIQRNPNSANSLIRFSPHAEQGQLTGYKIGAVGNKSDFKALGLEDGDIVTHVNGVELTDNFRALGLYRQMDELSEIRLQLTRQGQSQEILYRLPD